MPVSEHLAKLIELQPNVFVLVVLPETVKTSPLFPIHDGSVYTAPSLDSVGGINFIL